MMGSCTAVVPAKQTKKKKELAGGRMTLPN